MVEDTSTGKKYIFFPAMLLDVFLPLAAGREIYGIPKVLAQFNWTWASNTWSAEVDAEGFTAMDPNEIAGWRRVLGGDFGITVVPRLENPISSQVGQFLNSVVLPAKETALAALPNLQSAWTQMIQVLSGAYSLEAISLKQYPECGTPTDACYQSLVVNEFRPTALRSFRAGVGTVTFHDPASYPLATAVDHLPAPATVPGLSFGVEMDWRMGPGTILS